MVPALHSSTTDRLGPALPLGSSRSTFLHLVAYSSSSYSGAPSPLFFQFLSGGPSGLPGHGGEPLASGWAPHHHANPSHCSHLSIPPLFLLTPRKATVALALEFDLGWGAERGGWGTRAWRGGNEGSRQVRDVHSPRCLMQSGSSMMTTLKATLFRMGRQTMNRFSMPFVVLTHQTPLPFHPSPPLCLTVTLV